MARYRRLGSWLGLAAAVGLVAMLQQAGDSATVPKLPTADTADTGSSEPTASAFRSGPIAPADNRLPTTAVAAPRAPAVAPFEVRVSTGRSVAVRGEVKVFLRGSCRSASLLEGNATFEVAAGSIRAIDVAVPGYKRVAKTFTDGDVATNPFVVVLEPAGVVRVRVLDTAGTPLIGRQVGSELDQIGLGSIGDHLPALQARQAAHQITDDRGIAEFVHLRPGLHRFETPDFAQWLGARSILIAVNAGAEQEITLVALQRESTHYVAVHFDRRDFPKLEFHGGSTVGNFRLYHGVRRRYANLPWTGLHCIGEGQLVAVIPGEPGERVSAFLAAIDYLDSSRPGDPRSESFDLTIGTALRHTPVWQARAVPGACR
jgi:hypothetical protein